MVGRLGFEPRTYRFDNPTLSYGAGLYHHPQLYLFGCGALNAGN